MSDIYISKLRLVQKEFDATHDVVEYAHKNWYRQDIFIDIDQTSLEDLLRAKENLEAVFIIRLFTTFEGLLKHHMQDHHPTLHVPEDARAVWLIDRVALLQTPHISSPLRARVHDIRKYRNVLVHVGQKPLYVIPFTKALADLSTYLSKLPEPH